MRHQIATGSSKVCEKSGLVRQQSTGAVEGLPGGVTGVVTRQIDEHAGHIVGGLNPTDGHRCGRRCFVGTLGFAGTTRHFTIDEFPHRCIHNSTAYAIDEDAVAGQLRAQLFCQADGGVFGHRIDPERCRLSGCDLPGTAGIDQYPPALAL